MHGNAQKLTAKFPATTLSSSMVEVYPSQICFLRNYSARSKPSRRSITAAKNKKRRNRKGEKKKEKKEKPKVYCTQNFYFCPCLSRNVVKYGASGKKGMLSCCKCLFE